MPGPSTGQSRLPESRCPSSAKQKGASIGSRPKNSFLASAYSLRGNRRPNASIPPPISRIAMAEGSGTASMYAPKFICPFGAFMFSSKAQPDRFSQ